jgi:hypothetical protein
MKPLVFFCRWHDASLRLRGRDETAVWGHLVFSDEAGEESSQPFRFNLKTRQLTLEEDGEAGPAGTIQLDEMGTEVEE